MRRSVDFLFWSAAGSCVLCYAGLILAMLLADAAAVTWTDFAELLRDPVIRYAVVWSLVSATVSVTLALLVSVPAAYLIARVRFPGRTVVAALFDVPILLPPLVVGVSLLMLFRSTPLRAVDEYFGITFARPAVILAQFTIATAFATRILRATFEEQSPRGEQVAWTLGCTRWQAFRYVALPEARTGVLAALAVGWARSLGEFGPVLVFAGTTRMRVETLPITIHLELGMGNVSRAVAASLLLVALAAFVLAAAKILHHRGSKDE